jgi:hypothetical protein
MRILYEFQIAAAKYCHVALRCSSAMAVGKPCSAARMAQDRFSASCWPWDYGAFLPKALSSCSGHTAPVPISANATTTTKAPRRKISAEGRARIVAAQKARWAKSKKG